MKIRAFLAASAAAVSFAFGLGAASAHADIINLNQWYTGHFNSGIPSPLLAGDFALGTNGPVLPGGFAGALSAPQTPWSITLTHGGTLTVTDVEVAGDQFQLFDNGIPMLPVASPFHGAGQNPGQSGLLGGFTSLACNGCESSAGENINAALGDRNYSSGTFLLHSGTNDITGLYWGKIGGGDVDFIAESPAVPEPATWAMLILGVGMIGFAARRRNQGMALTA